MEVTAQARLAANEQGQRNETRDKLTEFIKTLDEAMTSSEETPAAQEDKPADAKDASLAPMLQKARANPQGPEHLALFGVAVSSSHANGVIVDGGYYNVSDLTISKAPAPQKGLIIQAKGARLSYHLDVDDGTKVTILGGRYEDKIKVAANVTRGMTIRALEGSDRIEGGGGRDVIFAGPGNDYVDGGGGDDIIHGEDGYDVLYGQDGRDVIYGGRGRDYIDGGDQDDWIWGGAGNDVISGGKGSDAIAGEAGDDVIVTASGRDVVSDWLGTNTFYTEQGDTIASNGESRFVAIAPPTDGLGRSVFIFGDARFTTRIGSDLETLRHIPVGQKALASLDASGKGTAIRPQAVWSEHPASAIPLDSVLKDVAGKASSNTGTGTGTDASNTLIGIDPAFRSLSDDDNRARDWRAAPPIINLFHEIAHAQDFAHGTEADGYTMENGKVTANRELSATGVPWDRDGDGKADANTRAITENELRRELGWPRRPSYDVPSVVLDSEPES